ncbi:copper resistance protein NlpE [Vibrio sp. WXL103]|uniref:copper resistance protein NlpE n=1 Tax=unclassified Vibrio TaxID=2614977 RepID=UPI003EC729B5
MQRISPLIILASLAVSACSDNMVKDTTPVVNADNNDSWPAHSARDSLDWDGTYVGKLPCADCPGIDISLTLNLDGSYRLVKHYQGHGENSFITEGEFSWNEAGSIITLDHSSPANSYFVAEGRLIKLNADGNKITGDLAEWYQITKQ